jgi:D-amino-acid dehydrogenase
MDALGVSYELLSADDIRKLEPALAPIFHHGIFQKSSLRCDDTAGLVRAMVDEAVSAGATFRVATVTALKPQDQRVQVRCGSETLDARRVVVAAGAWSRRLAAQVGHKVPLDTERGYHVMLPRGTEALLSRPVLNGERSFVLSPMRAGMRMTSQVEIAGVDAPSNFARVRHLLPEARRMLPDLDVREESVWMGCRPSLPDSLPVIGPARNAPNVLFAFGHQHLGLTLAAVTAFAVAAVVAGREPAVDLSPYRAERF